MRKIATIVAFMALATVQAAPAAAAAQAQSSIETVDQRDDAGGTAFPLAGGATDGGVLVSLTALTAFMLGIVAAVQKRHNGRPASP